MMSARVPTCPVCSATGAAFFASRRDRLFNAVAGGFKLLRCRTCGSIFQHPIPQESEIGSFYPQQYWWSSAGPDAGALSRCLKGLENRYREFVALDHIRFLESCARRAGAKKRLLLDIGCGSGMMLGLARKRGFEPFGMDMSEQAVALARERYGLKVLQGKVGDDLWAPAQFDFVTMYHVLEHLADPRSALRYVRRLLKPDGNLILQVPNIESLQARCFGPCWYGLDVPRHLMNFTPGAIDLLLGETGFRVERRARFSLRDNPASIASSIAIDLDPVGRAARSSKGGALREAALAFVYSCLVLASLPLAALESLFGRGGTIWLHARPVEIPHVTREAPKL